MWYDSDTMDNLWPALLAFGVLGCSPDRVEAPSTPSADPSDSSPFGFQDLQSYEPEMAELGRWARLTGATGLGMGPR